MASRLPPAITWPECARYIALALLNDTAGDRYRNALGVATVEADAANTFVLKPEVSTWIDLSPKIGLNISTGYMVARPHVILRTPAGQDKRRVNADMMMIKVGIVYSIF